MFLWIGCFGFAFIVDTSEGLDWTRFKLPRRNFWNVSFVPPPFAAAPPAIEMEHLLAQRGAAATLYTCALYFMFRLNTLYLICHILYWSREGQLLVPSTFTWKDWNSIEECEKNVSSSTILLLDFVIRAQSEGWHHFVTIEQLRLTPEDTLSTRQHSAPEHLRTWRYFFSREHWPRLTLNLHLCISAWYSSNWYGWVDVK